ncbi:MAG: hypothetical protein ACP5XB_19015 [Isosphaeraceae bacterium]
MKLETPGATVWRAEQPAILAEAIGSRDTKGSSPRRGDGVNARVRFPVPGSNPVSETAALRT